MELLFSDIPPFTHSRKDFKTCFDHLLMDSESLKIATGFISQDSIIELARFIEDNKRPRLELVIGMHYFEGITRLQHQSVQRLDALLKSTGRGFVKVVTAFPFHGKLYLFGNDSNPTASILGSSNLTKIIYNRTFEADILLTESKEIRKIEDLILNLAEKASIDFSRWEVKRFLENNPLLLDLPGVEKCSPAELEKVHSKAKNLSFHIPLKADEAPKSNLNIFFGKGREDKRGMVKRRHWYEAELIVPKSITSNDAYPKAGYPLTESTIKVYTDDGWKFDCKISGQNSKNFRSADDLKILGRWMKGRLENSGALTIGEPVTDEVLKRYGRDTWELTATNDPSTWLINFGVGE